MESWTTWCPTMFENTPKRNTKRFFLYASDQIAELLRRKYRVEGYLAPDYDYLAHMAWLIGATSAAQALIREVDLVKAAWGSGDDRKTHSLIKACLPNVLSVWVGGVDQRPQLTGDGRRAEYERAAASMFGIINESLAAAPSGAGLMTARGSQDAVALDRQWVSEGQEDGLPPVYACLVLSRALEACGQRSIEWAGMPLPLISIQAFLDTGALLEESLLGDIQRLRRVMGCLAEGAVSMKRFHAMNMAGKVG